MERRKAGKTLPRYLRIGGKKFVLRELKDPTERIGFEELAKIQGRVGDTPVQRLRWAVEFAQRDLDGLSDGDWANLRSELAAFDSWVIPLDQVTSRRARKALRDGTEPPDADPRGFALPSERDVRAIQDGVRLTVRMLLDTDETVIEPAKVSFVITRDSRRSWLFRLPGPAWGGLALALVRECPEPKCRRWFVASRTNQWFCSTRCQTRASTRAYRAARLRKRK
jgi:hypothetical protein